MARRGPAAGVAGLYPDPAAPGVRDEPPAPRRQRHVAARLRRADGAERRRRGPDADHGARRPYRLGTQPGVPPRAADERPGPGDVRAVRGGQAGHRGGPDRPRAAGPAGRGGRTRGAGPAVVLRGAAGGPGGAARRGAGKRVRQHHQTRLAPAAGRLAPGGGLRGPTPSPPGPCSGSCCAWNRRETRQRPAFASLQSSGCLAMTSGSRPASSQPAPAAISGSPTSRIRTSETSTSPNVADGLVWVQASPAITAPATPRTAPSRPSAAAVAAVIIRRVLALAPVAVSVRRSRAVSLRIRPTDMASTPNAITMPSAVTPSVISPRLSEPDFVSTVNPKASASCLAVSICAAVSGPGVWMSQPSRLRVR